MVGRRICICMIKKIDSSKSRLPPRPDLEWGEDGIPRDQINDDVYFSVSDGLEETREVFFRGCGLPERWADTPIFTIAELGFGTGLNIAALIQLWRENRPSTNAVLEVVSFEGRLMSGQSAKQALSAWPELADEVSGLLANWPDRARGVQRIDLGRGMYLTLHQDDVLDALRNAKFKADAWFLDGFSPSKNPDMWSQDVMHEIANHSNIGALIGTYTVAGHVRRSLANAGFEASKQPGFGKKRERLEAKYSSSNPLEQAPDPLLLSGAPEHPKSVVIIGAGIMGACLANSFQQKGCHVTVLDAADNIEQGASANPLGLVAPRIDSYDTPQARLLIDAYLYARRFYKRFLGAAWSVDVEHFSNTAEEIKRHQRILEEPPLDEDLLKELGTQDGLKYFGGVAVSPIEVRYKLLEDISIQWGAKVKSIDLSGQGKRVATGITSNGEAFSYQADLVILSGGMGVDALLSDGSFSLRGRGGQLETIPYTGNPIARSKGHYVVGVDGKLVFGATYQDNDGAPPDVSDDARDQNLQALRELAPDIESQLNAIKSRTAVRAATSDQLPIAGRVPDFAEYRSVYGEDLRTGRRLQVGKPPVEEGLYVYSGLGSRGLTWAPFLAECAVAEAFGSVFPTGLAGRELLSPARIIMRQLKRSKKEKN